MLSSGIPRNIFHEWLQFSEYTRTRRVEVKNQLFMSGTFLCERADKPYDIQSGLFLRLKSSISSSVVSFRYTFLTSLLIRCSAHADCARTLFGGSKLWRARIMAGKQLLIDCIFIHCREPVRLVCTS